MSTLHERIAATAAELGERSIAEMYKDPFWRERFGARGREMAEKDAQFHVSYLLSALAASDPGVLTTYARWLQTLLVSRGMCSLHIAENFEQLALAIAQDIPESEPAVALLRGAVAALTYDGGPERELQDRLASLADATVDTLARRDPTWFAAASSFTSLASYESIAQAEMARCHERVREHIAYLADAMHAGRPELFSAHAVWMRGFLERRQAPWARLEETLRALRDCLKPAKLGSPSAAPGAGSAADGRPEGQRASVRPKLSQPPAPAVPVAVSSELSARSVALIDAALERLASPAALSTPPRAADEEPE